MEQVELAGASRARAWIAGAAFLALVFMAAPAAAERLGAYDFPFVDPVTATVVGTPVAFQADLPDLLEDRILERRRVVMFPDREVPDVFYYDNQGVRYGLARQQGRAPLVFAIAGTGGSEVSTTVMTLAAGLYSGGYHVITLPSPTSLNFIINGSTTRIPGHMENDTADLYAVIQRIIEEIGETLDYDAIHLTGLSLGGLNTGWLAELDARERKVGFARALLLNPPVNLVNSTRILDAYFDDNVAAEPGAVGRFMNDIFTRFATQHGQDAGSLDLSSDFIYQLYRVVEPRGDDLEALVGLSFRISAGNIAFVSDVMSTANFVVPEDSVLVSNSRLFEFANILGALSFDDYIKGIYMPYYSAREPGLTFDIAAARESLNTIEPFLRRASHVGLIGTEDDIILAPGEVDYMEDVFGARAAFFPTGGHCGNFAQPDFVARMNAWFAERSDS